MCIESWVATYADHLSPSTIEHVTTHWHDPKLLRSQVEKPGDFFAVARAEGKIGITGVVAVTREELHLARLGVCREHQGTGVGSRLLDEAIAAYPDAQVVRLEVEQENTRAHSYWRHRQFVDTGTSRANGYGSNSCGYYGTKAPMISSSALVKARPNERCSAEADERSLLTSVPAGRHCRNPRSLLVR